MKAVMVSPRKKPKKRCSIGVLQGCEERHRPIEHKQKRLGEKQEETNTLPEDEKKQDSACNHVATPIISCLDMFCPFWPVLLFDA